jgi:hypothetical protein
MTIKEGSTVLATWFVVLGTLAGGYAGLSTYQSDSAKRLDDRQKQTFALILHFITRDFIALREKMIKVVREAEKCGNSWTALAGIGDSERFAFFEFFDIVHACTDAQMCDVDLVERVFVPYANGHWPVFKRFVLSVREGEKPHNLKLPFGLGLEKLARTPLSLPKCPNLR